MFKSIKKINFTSFGIIGGLLALAAVIGLFFGLTLWTERSLDFIALHMFHNANHVSGWLAFLATVLLNGIIIAFNVIIEIIRALMGF